MGEKERTENREQKSDRGERRQKRVKIEIKEMFGIKKVIFMAHVCDE